MRRCTKKKRKDWKKIQLGFIVTVKMEAVNEIKIRSFK